MTIQEMRRLPAEEFADALNKIPLDVFLSMVREYAEDDGYREDKDKWQL